MSAQFPRNNLAPESRPWGRDLEQRLAALELYRDTQATRTDNTYAGLLASLAAMGTQINSLSAQQTTLNTLLSAQAAFDRVGNGTTNFAVPTTDTAVFSQTITVPSGGYTKALVLCICSATVYSMSTSTAGIYLKANINQVSTFLGSSGALDPTNGFNWMAFSSAATATLSGLSAGDTITFNACMRSTNAIPANTNSTVTLDGLTIFLK